MLMQTENIILFMAFQNWKVLQHTIHMAVYLWYQIGNSTQLLAYQLISFLHICDSSSKSYTLLVLFKGNIW